MTVAELLRTLRESLGLSQTELGTKLGVSLNTIHVWEKGVREPSASHLQALAALAKVRISVGAVGWRVGKISVPGPNEAGSGRAGGSSP